MIAQLTGEHYRTVSRNLGVLVAACSAFSAVLIGTAPAPGGFGVLDPGAVKATMLILLGAVGVILTVAAAFGPKKLFAVKAAVFEVAAIANAAVLSPLLVLPIQGATSLLAVLAAMGLAIINVPAFHSASTRPQQK
ncbi:hypothetical protein AB6813_19805 [bacterium RCC_150]